MPGMPDSPKAIKQPDSYPKRDQQDEPAVGRVIKQARCFLPPSKPQTQETENASREQASKRVSEGIRNPKARDRREPNENRGGDEKRNEVDRRGANARFAPHGAGAITQDQ